MMLMRGIIEYSWSSTFLAKQLPDYYATRPDKNKALKECFSIQVKAQIQVKIKVFKGKNAKNRLLAPKFRSKSQLYVFKNTLLEKQAFFAAN